MIQRIRAFLKKEYLKTVPVLNAGSQESSLPRRASAHQINLLKRARKSITSKICDIDRYLDSEPIEWDNTNKANFEPY